jgi:hypothetical protein
MPRGPVVANPFSIALANGMHRCVRQLFIVITRFANLWLLQFFGSAIQIRMAN